MLIEYTLHMKHCPQKPLFRQAFSDNNKSEHLCYSLCFIKYGHIDDALISQVIKMIP